MTGGRESVYEAARPRGLYVVRKLDLKEGVSSYPTFPCEKTTI